MAKSPIEPKLGDDVIYVAAGKDDTDVTINGALVSIAKVCNVFDNSENKDTLVNLRLFPDSPKVPWRTGVKYDPEKAPETWHWPND